MRRPREGSIAAVHAAVRHSLDAHVLPGSPLAIGLSGGRDSVVLLDALASVAASRGHALAAIHVHHGLSANADAWARFCTDLCASMGIACEVRRVVVARVPRTSVEATARDARYRALGEAAHERGTAVVALAHHRNDQAETVLLQLLRGAGPHGLAAMPALREDASGIAWWRPLLDTSRADIDAYARERALSWIEDESNTDGRHARNAVRQTVLPALRAIAAGADTTLARAAAHQAEAAALLDDLAEQDAHGAVDGATLARETLVAIAPHRARNLLRWFLRRQGLPAPSTARLNAMVDQLRGARIDSVVRLMHAGAEIGVHRGRIVLHAARPADFDIRWSGESQLMLPHGTLEFGHAKGKGIAVSLLADATLRIRSRVGGERFQVAPDRPRRALKSILRDCGIPPWERLGLPLVFCGEALAAVPGVGVDASFRTPPAQPGLTVDWHPNFR